MARHRLHLVDDKRARVRFQIKYRINAPRGPSPERNGSLPVAGVTTAQIRVYPFQRPPTPGFCRISKPALGIGKTVHHIAKRICNNNLSLAIWQVAEGIYRSSTSKGGEQILVCPGSKNEVSPTIQS